ncbi:MAG TPA: glycosyltransferase family 4 protein [Myxococcaceae bacterium]|nr:glycosyltransferase family 4 protein [Myxococcaceae bacterium]
MRIAEVAPLFESVPPKYYGGTERVVAYLTEELVRQGHRVTLFASGDSATSAELVSPCREALRLSKHFTDWMPHHLVMLEQLFRRRGDFDVVHFHLDALHFPFARRAHLPNVTTLHGRLDIPDLVPLFREYREMQVVSISNSQRRPLPWLPWLATVHHGLPENLYPLQERPQPYLAFLGRISKEKRVDRAIHIAERVGLKLKIAAKIDKSDREYFDSMKRLFRRPLVEYVGELGEKEKHDFLGNALALLFPIEWPEPFGLVLIEAMACGTPTVAYLQGAVPEIITDGVTGYVVRTVEGAVNAVNRIGELDRRRCRRMFEQYFTAARMARDYLSVFSVLLGEPAHPLHLAKQSVS